MKQREWSYNFGLLAAAAEDKVAGAHAQPGSSWADTISPEIFQKC